MAETRFERDLRDHLTAELDAVHGPHPHWAGSPAARRIGRTLLPSRRPLIAAAAVIAAAVVLSVAMAIGALPWARQPVATNPATPLPTNEPLPGVVSPSASPTIGEVPMGRVAISTQHSVPAVAIRVIALPSSAGEAVIRIDLRVVGPIVEAVGVSRFVVYHDGKTDPLPTSSGPDPLAIPAGAGVGTTVYAEFTIPVRDDEWADLGYTGVPGSAAFTYPMHRPVSASATPAIPGECPTLADYAAASAVPTDAPKPKPSFDPVDPAAPPTTGTIAVGSTGVLAAPDGSAGALIRVSNARFCDRLPDFRPDAIFQGPGASLLLADVDILVLKDGTLDGLIPGGDSTAAAVYQGWNKLSSMGPTWFPGVNRTSTVATGPGFTYHGTFAWMVPGSGGQVSVGVFGSRSGYDAAPQFSYPVRAGTVGASPLRTIPPPTPQPTLTPAQAPLPLDTPAVVAIGGANVDLQVGGVQQVARYTGVVPTTPGDAFLEIRFLLLRNTVAYSWNPADWVVIGPDRAPARMLPGFVNGSDPTGQPQFSVPGEKVDMPPDSPGLLFQVAEVPTTGRVTLEYRPNGGPAVATWVLREQ